jgi:aldose 1-epimerase
MRVTNQSQTACPYGTGAHPYLSVETPTIDMAECQVPGAVHLPVDDAGIPTGRRLVDGILYEGLSSLGPGQTHQAQWGIDPWL